MTPGPPHWLGVGIATGWLGLSCGCDTPGSPSPAATTSSLVEEAAAPVRRARARAGSQIRPDEVVQWFPTYGYYGQGAWQFELHAAVFEPELTSSRRKLASRVLAQALERYVGGSLDPEKTQHRLAQFLVDSESNKPLAAWVVEREFSLGHTDGTGHVSRWLTAPGLPVDFLKRGGQLRGTAVLPIGDERQFVLDVELVAERGVSIVSDVDDTLKVSEVMDPKALARNALSRPWRAVAGIADKLRAYRRQGATLHYLSSMPWQLYPQLRAFQREVGLPSGSVHLRGLSPSSLLEFASAEASAQHKLDQLRQILGHFPHRRFILLGDSGERDPEIYAEISATHPQQIQSIWIRSLTGESQRASRYRRLRRAAPGVPWVVFSDAVALPEAL